MSGVNINFTHDTEMGLLATTDLVNTTAERSGSGRDELSTPGDLQRFVVEHRYSGSRTHDQPELDAVRNVRPRLSTLWTDDAGLAIDRVNALLREYNALPQLVRHDGWDWHIHAIDSDAPLADRICVETAIAFIDLIRGDELGRLKNCAAEDCNAVLIDLSRNRSKRYCDVGNCGNRANVAAYRARRAGR
ncbi:MAG: CGNR zinc finger domain-containing protein [Euzebya sp.]